jgi:hypothetical protein
MEGIYQPYVWKHSFVLQVMLEQSTGYTWLCSNAVRNRCVPAWHREPRGAGEDSR